MAIEKKRIVDTWRKDKELQEAREYHNKNPLLFRILQLLRQKAPKLSVRKISKQIEEETGKNVSPANIQKIKDKYPFLLKDNNLFRDFMELIGINPKENNKNLYKKTKRKYEIKKREERLKQKEKLKKEIEKARILLTELNNDKMSETEKWKLVEGGRRQVAKIKERLNEGGELDSIDEINELLQLNVKIIVEGKKILKDSIEKLKPRNLSEAKVLSDIIDTAFKQNRLIRGESTENHLVGVVDIYDNIVNNAQNNLEQEKEKPTLVIPKQD